MNEELTRACITSCQKCAAHCEQTAVACSLSSNVNSLARCIELAIYCADMCRLTAAFLERGEIHALRSGSLCAEICDILATECEKFRDISCVRCALVCRECAEVCRKTSTFPALKSISDIAGLRETA